MSRILTTMCIAVLMITVNSGAYAQVNETAKCKNSAAEQAPFFEQGMPLHDSKDGTYKADPVPYDGHYASGYSAAAGPRVDSSWDINANASFIYWYYSQDAMDVTYVAPIAGIIPGEVVTTDFVYKPGFKVGIGVDTHFDNWAINTEYTWFHHSNSSAASSIAGYTPNNWFEPGSIDEYTDVSSLWGVHLDMIDLVCGRPYYEGTNLVIAPNGGIRALWIHQGLNVTMTDIISPTISSTSYSHSWAIGPKAGVNSKWLIWKGLRLDGMMGSSLLFTRYTLLSNSEAIEGVGTTTTTGEDINALRPTFEAGVGLGYGAYLFKNKFFIDLSARYDFAQFWSQNMMRNFASQLSGRSNTIGDLAMHGLTVNLRCDF